jgi:hypothetical protein
VLTSGQEGGSASACAGRVCALILGVYVCVRQADKREAAHALGVAAIDASGRAQILGVHHSVARLGSLLASGDSSIERFVTLNRALTEP